MKQRLLAGQTYTGYWVSHGLRIITITYDSVSRRTVIEYEYANGFRDYALEPDFRRMITFREFNEAETTEGE